MLHQSTLIVSNAINGGGAEKSSMELFKELSSHYKEIYFCALNNSAIDQKTFTDNRINQLQRNWKSGPFETFRTFLRFKALVHELKPKIVVVNCELPELFVALLPIKLNRIIAVEHTSRPWYRRKILGFFVRFLLLMKKCEWVSVSSNEIYIWPFRILARHIPNPITGVAKLRDSGKANINGIEEASRGSLIFIGRLREEKRAQLLVEAAIDCEVSLELFGEGPELTKLLQMASNFRDSITFHGFINDPWALIGEDDLVVVLSLFEGDGMVIAEAIINGNSILLAENEDLRRFQLPDDHYFKSKLELENKIDDWKKSSKDLFRPPTEVRDRVKNERDIVSICNTWQKYLQADGSESEF